MNNNRTDEEGKGKSITVNVGKETKIRNGKHKAKNWARKVF
jgi:hypothetical protein